MVGYNMLDSEDFGLEILAFITIGLLISLVFAGILRTISLCIYRAYDEDDTNPIRLAFGEFLASIWWPVILAVIVHLEVTLPLLCSIINNDAVQKYFRWSPPQVKV